MIRNVKQNMSYLLTKREESTICDNCLQQQICESKIYFSTLKEKGIF